MEGGEGKGGEARAREDEAGYYGSVWRRQMK